MVARLQGKVPGRKQISGKLSNAIVDNSKILVFDTHYDFPSVGKTQAIYVAKEENALYRWDDDELLYLSCTGVKFGDEFDAKVDELINEKLKEIVLITGGNANG